MLPELFKLFREKTGLVSDARNEALNMLDHGRRMFDIVMQTLLKTPDVDVLDQIKHLDQDINRVQRAVRRKVMEQLVFCRGQDVIDAIVLLTVVVDLERIGDYTKNIAELADMMSKRCSLGKKEELVKDLHSRTVALFGTVRYAYERNSANKARKAVKDYEYIARTCDKNLEEIFQSAIGEELVPNEYLAVVLILRYIKRVSAHLKNVATTVINPIDQIGFVGDEVED